jgi:diamine N-acetyltransferase
MRIGRDGSEPGRSLATVAVILEEITDENREAVLALRVAPGQERFVSSVADSLADAAAYPHARPWYRAVFAAGPAGPAGPVGFVMVSWNAEPDPPQIIGPWFLWKLLIDERYQGRGYGTAVVRRIAELVRAEGAAELLTSYVPENDGPAEFYRRLGFVPTGELDEDGEVIARLELPPGTAGGGDAFAAWREMREREGPRVSLIRLYALVAEPRGLQPHELPLAERRELATRAAPLLWPGFQDNERAQPRDPEPVQVIAYDPAWPDRFDAWRGRLAGLLGPVACRIEHVGSTSVPGLAAKPVVDMQISVADMAEEERYVPACEKAGLQLRFRDDQHRYFQPPPGQPRAVHVHVCQLGGQWERLHLLFRDYLRASGGARETYAAAKRQAARLWADQSAAYTEAKSDVILDILNGAQSWADATGWVT